ncbi:MAG: ABC transporter permease [Dongiaceae bacterium]
MAGPTEENLGAVADGRTRAPRRGRPGGTAWIGLCIIGSCLFFALLAPVLAPHPPATILTAQSYAPPDGTSWLGTDYLGRDVLSRLLYGARLTIGLAFLSTLLGFVVGTTLGFAAAELRGIPDTLIGRVVDIMISFPPILLALVVIAGLGSSLTVLVCTIGLIHTSRVTRMARAVALNISATDFVEVARSRGEGLAYIVWREILPNTIRPLATEFGLRLTFSVLFISSLSFLGLGVQPPAADWGGMVRENMSGLYYGAWAALLPAAAIAVLTVGISFVVDWLAAQSGREMSSELLQ